MHPRSSEGPTSQETLKSPGVQAQWLWTHCRSCTDINHVHEDILTERCHICCSGAWGEWELWYGNCLFHCWALRHHSDCIFSFSRTSGNAHHGRRRRAELLWVLLFTLWCQITSLRDSKPKTEFVSFLSSSGLEVLYPLRHQEASKYNLYPTVLTIKNVSLSNDTKSWYFPSQLHYQGFKILMRKVKPLKFLCTLPALSAAQPNVVAWWCFSQSNSQLC